MEFNKDLVRRFVNNAGRLLSPEDGEIHMCHKTKPPFNQWKLEQVAVESLNDEGPLLEYAGRIVLDKFLLPPYTPRKALDKKSFPCHDACFYIFQQKRKSLVADKDSKLFTATIDSNSINSEETPSLEPVTPELIMKIRRAIIDASVHKKGNKKERKWQAKRSRHRR